MVGLEINAANTLLNNKAVNGLVYRSTPSTQYRRLESTGQTISELCRVKLASLDEISYFTSLLFKDLLLIAQRAKIYAEHLNLPSSTEFLQKYFASTVAPGQCA